MYVRAKLVDDGIELSYQVKTKIEDGKLFVYDENGDIGYSEFIVNIEYYPEETKIVGVIPVLDDFIDFCGCYDFEEVVASVMRHAVEMAVRGYGDSINDIILWFTDIKEKKFLEGVKYRFINNVNPFINFIGVECVVSVESADGGCVIFFAEMEVKGEKYSVELDDKTLISFILSTTPV